MSKASHNRCDAGALLTRGSLGPSVEMHRATFGDMHIGFRSSGGRGEYELVGRHGAVHASELVGWTLRWDLKDIGLRESNLWIDPGGSGKLRLRAYETNWSQIGRQTAGLLLLPDPVRDRNAPRPGPDILRRKEYLLTTIGFRTDSDLNPGTETITIRPAFVEVANASDSDIIGFESRWDRVLAVHNSTDALPVLVASAVRAHTQSLAEEAIGRRVISAAEQVSTALLATVPSYIEGHDVLPVLERLARLSIPPGPALPGVEEIGVGEIEARIRSASERRMVRTRGHSATVFSRKVRAAYDHTCAFCGLQLPGNSGIKSGVDAAHILAWSEYDLDVVVNGLCLCKKHHWAFDQAVLAVKHVDSLYIVETTPRLALFNDFTQSELARAVGEIDKRRLPALTKSWPSPQYLERLYADIDFTVSI